LNRELITRGRPDTTPKNFSPLRSVAAPSSGASLAKTFAMFCFAQATRRVSRAILGGKVASSNHRANIRQIGAFWKALVKAVSKPFRDKHENEKNNFSFLHSACVETYLVQYVIKLKLVFDS
jgi:hypothetical protein